MTQAGRVGLLHGRAVVQISRVGFQLDDSVSRHFSLHFSLRLPLFQIIIIYYLEVTLMIFIIRIIFD